MIDRRGKTEMLAKNRLVATSMQRAQTLIRDGFACQVCGLSGVPGKGKRDLQIHHKVSALHGGTNDLDNLQTLCRPCHVKADEQLRKERGKQFSSAYLESVKQTVQRFQTSPADLHPSFSTSEAALILGVSRQRVFQVIQSGLLPAQKQGRDWLVSSANLAAYQPRQPGRPAGRKNRR